MADPVWTDNVTPLNAVNMTKLQTRDEKAAANGYPSLDGTGKVPVAQLPAVGAALSYDGDWAAGTYQDGQVVVKDGIAYLCVGGPTTVAPDPVPWGLASTAASYGTSLPASPIDGQEHVLVDSLTNPTYQWRFRYNAGSSSAYKWEFVGGSAAHRHVATGEQTVSAGPVDLATVGPQFAIPRDGEYWAQAEAVLTQGDPTNSYLVGIYIPVFSGITFATMMRGDGVGWAGNLSGITPKQALTAGTNVKLQYGTQAGIFTWSGRTLVVTPVRVS